MLPPSFYQQGSLELAKALLGCELVHETAEGVTSGIIVETEAYRQDDEASHSYRGLTPRCAPMFGPGGHAYVYFTYGMHYCFNVVAGFTGFAEAVLIRALEPSRGVQLMAKRRQTHDMLNLCSGPAKLVQALGISLGDNGAKLDGNLHILPSQTQPSISTSPRIGIRRAMDKPWRFFMTDNPHVTRHSYNRVAA